MPFARLDAVPVLFTEVWGMLDKQRRIFAKGDSQMEIFVNFVYLQNPRSANQSIVCQTSRFVILGVMRHNNEYLDNEDRGLLTHTGECPSARRMKAKLNSPISEYQPITRDVWRVRVICIFSSFSPRTNLNVISRLPFILLNLFRRDTARIILRVAGWFAFSEKRTARAFASQMADITRTASW